MSNSTPSAGVLPIATAMRSGIMGGEAIPPIRFALLRRPELGKNPDPACCGSRGRGDGAPLWPGETNWRSQTAGGPIVQLVRLNLPTEGNAFRVWHAKIGRASC